METDRDAALTLRTAAEGTIDYRRAKPPYVDWLRYWRWMIEQYARKLNEKVLRSNIEFRLAQLTAIGASHRQFSDWNKQAHDLVHDLRSLHYSWLSDSSDSPVSAESFATLWKEKTGFDLNDTEKMAAWEKKVENVLKAQGMNDTDQYQRSLQIYKDRAAAVRAKRKAQQQRR